jgi:hypothetical protein
MLQWRRCVCDLLSCCWPNVCEPTKVLPSFQLLISMAGVPGTRSTRVLELLTRGKNSDWSSVFTDTGLFHGTASGAATVIPDE